MTDDAPPTSAILRDLADRYDRGEPVAYVVLFVESPDRQPDGVDAGFDALPPVTALEMRGLLRALDRRLDAVASARTAAPRSAPRPRLRLVESGDG